MCLSGCGLGESRSRRGCEMQRATEARTQVEPGRLRGRVLSYSPGRGYGWILQESGDRDLFVHQKQVQAASLDALRVGDRVEYSLVEGRDGKFSAHDIRLVEIVK
jgi:cold shock protein